MGNPGMNVLAPLGLDDLRFLDVVRIEREILLYRLSDGFLFLRLNLLRRFGWSLSGAAGALAATAGCSGAAAAATGSGGADSPLELWTGASGATVASGFGALGFFSAGAFAGFFSSESAMSKS